MADQTNAEVSDERLREIIAGCEGARGRPRTSGSGEAVSDLTLPLKAEYFDAILDGTKPEEYRRVTPYWLKRIEGRSFDRIVLTRGYPAADDWGRRIFREWRGYERRTITHPHFGPEPVEVFAIDVSAPLLSRTAGSTP